MEVKEVKKFRKKILKLNLEELRDEDLVKALLSLESPLMDLKSIAGVIQNSN